MRPLHLLLGSILLMTAIMAPSTRAGPLHDAIVAEDMNRVNAEIVSGADVNEEDLLQGLPAV